MGRAGDWDFAAVILDGDTAPVDLGTCGRAWPFMPGSGGPADTLPDCCRGIVDVAPISWGWLWAALFASEDGNGAPSAAEWTPPTAPGLDELIWPF